MTALTPLVAGNWKMNKLPSEVTAWTQDLLQKLAELPDNSAPCNIAFCVPFTHLSFMMKELESQKNSLKNTPVSLGSQDISTYEKGAYTGEISASMLKDLNVTYAIVGHSERRAYHQEDNAKVNAKAQAALHAGLVPIVCVGESLEVREAGNAQDVVTKQLADSLENTSLTRADQLIVAYEPIWAIGTGKTATATDAQTMAHAIRKQLKTQYGELAENMRILYGGSMKPQNAAELLEQPDINGGLIGGASLNVEDIIAIVKAA